MFTFLNSKSLWIGTNVEKFNQIKDALNSKSISYKYKVKNRLGQWNGRGTTRGTFGSFGNQATQMYQYEIYVYKKDFEQAKYLANRE